MMGLALFGGCLLLASLLVDQFMEGDTWELILVDLSLGVGSAVCFLMAWQQLVTAPKRDYLEQSFRPTYRRPPLRMTKQPPSVVLANSPICEYRLSQNWPGLLPR